MAWTSGTLDASCGIYYPPGCYNPPRAILDIRSIGIPSNAPMFIQDFTWATQGACVTTCTTIGDYEWATTDGTALTIPLTNTFGTAGATNLTLATANLTSDNTTGATLLQGYRVKPLRL